MIEAISIGIPLLAFFIGYGVLREQVRSNKVTADERHIFYIKELDSMKKNNDELKNTMNKILVQLERVSSHIEYIKQKIED